MNTLDELINVLHTSDNTESIILSSDYDVHSTQSDGYSSIHFAAKNNNVTLMKELLQRGTNVLLQANDGATPLYIACESGSHAIVEFLLSNSEVVNSSHHNKLHESNASPLLIASIKGYSDIINTLSTVKSLPFCEIISKEGGRSLLSAVVCGNLNTVIAVCGCISKSENPSKALNTTDSGGATSFMLACLADKREVINFLLSIDDVDINMCLPDKTSPLLAMCENENLGGIEKIINERGNTVDINTTRDSDGCNPLLTSVKCDSLEIVSVLLTCSSININITSTSDFGTPLLIASERDYTSMAQLLLSHPDINVNCCFDFGSTPLIIASHNGNLPLVKSLTNLAATDVNATTADGATALFIACQMHHIDIVTHLLLLNETPLTLNSKLTTTGETAFHHICTDYSIPSQEENFN